MRKHYYLVEIELNEPVEGFYLLKDVSIQANCCNSPCLFAHLADVSCSTDAVFWNYSGNVDEACRGEIVYIRGALSNCSGQIQLVLSEIRRPTEEEMQLHVDLEELIPSAKVTYEWELNTLENIMKTVKDEDCRKIYEYIREKYGRLMWTMPATDGGHHSHTAGWLTHTVNMLRMAETIASCYCGFLDRDLLLTGVFLHDVGKFRSFTFSRYGLVTGYTTEGLLLGGSVLSALEIREAAAKLNVPNDKVMLLLHMVLSRYDAPEQGMANDAAFPEAYVLACLNKMDIAMDRYINAMVPAGKGNFSAEIPELNRRVYYREEMKRITPEDKEEDKEDDNDEA